MQTYHFGRMLSRNNPLMIASINFITDRFQTDSISSQKSRTQSIWQIIWTSILSDLIGDYRHIEASSFIDLCSNLSQLHRYHVKKQSPNNFDWYYMLYELELNEYPAIRNCFLVFYYMISGTNPGLDINYNFDDMKVKQRNLRVLWNVHNYLLDMNWEPIGLKQQHNVHGW